MKPNFGWSLPPGVSAQDIDRHFGGDEDECVHGADLRDCQDCADEARDLEGEAAEQRAEAMRERDY